MSGLASQLSPHPRDLEDVEMSDISTRITSSATPANGHGPEQPSPVISDIDGDATDLDAISVSYHEILKHYGTVKTRGHGLEYQLLWTSLATTHAKDDEVHCRALIADLQLRQPPKITLYENSQRLAEELPENTENTEAETTKLVVLEDLSLKHICVVASRFKIHPSVFARHFIHLRFTSLHSENMATFLAPNLPAPSQGIGSAPRYFMLRYLDIIPKDPDSFHKASPHQPWLRRHKGYPHYDFAIFNVLRRVFIPPKNGDWDVDGEVVTVQSKLSIWKDPSSKQMVVLVDPTIRDPKLIQLLSDTATPDETSLRIHFADTLPQPSTAPIDLEQLESPPSIASPSPNLFDDIQNTLNSSTSNCLSSDPAEKLIVFLRQYVISKWITYLNHVHRCLVSVRDKQSVRSMQPDGGWSEDMFVALKYWSEYLPMVQLTIEANMAALGIMDPFDNRTLSSQYAATSAIGNESEDAAREVKVWRYIHRMLGNYAKMFERVADSYTQVVAIKEAQSSTIQAQASATQAQFVGRLTFLGTLFLPASLVAGVLSMGGDFLPGQRLFWVYIAVLIPVLLIVILVLFTDLGTIFLPDPSFTTTTTTTTGGGSGKTTSGKSKEGFWGTVFSKDFWVAAISWI